MRGFRERTATRSFVLGVMYSVLALLFPPLLNYMFDTLIPPAFFERVAGVEEIVEIMIIGCGVVLFVIALYHFYIGWTSSNEIDRSAGENQQ